MKPELIMCILGFGIFLQCMDSTLYEDKKFHALCVAGKLLLTAALLWCVPVLFFSLLGYFCFFPKAEEKPWIYAMQTGGTLFLGAGCVFLPSGAYAAGADVKVFGVFCVVVFLMLAAELVVRTMERKNSALYAQVKQTAIGELKVKNLNRKLAVRSQTAEHNARLAEREAIARNIHNVVGHTITAALVSMQASEVLAKTQPVRAKEKRDAATERMHLALEEIRRVVRVMDADTGQISIRDFAGLLVDEADKFVMDTELKLTHNLGEYLRTNLQTGRREDLPEVMVEKQNAVFLHSVLTECINNGIRHGAATEFFVYLLHDSEHIRLTVQDNGRGFEHRNAREIEDCLEQGYGLKKITEYVQENGGSIEIDGSEGFRVQVMLPLLR